MEIKEKVSALIAYSLSTGKRQSDDILPSTMVVDLETVSGGITCPLVFKCTCLNVCNCGSGVVHLRVTYTVYYTAAYAYECV